MTDDRQDFELRISDFEFKSQSWDLSNSRFEFRNPKFLILSALSPEPSTLHPQLSTQLRVRMATPEYPFDRTTAFSPFAFLFPSLPNTIFQSEKCARYSVTLS